VKLVSLISDAKEIEGLSLVELKFAVIWYDKILLQTNYANEVENWLDVQRASLNLPNTVTDQLLKRFAPAKQYLPIWGWPSYWRAKREFRDELESGIEELEEEASDVLGIRTIPSGFFDDEDDPERKSLNKALFLWGQGQTSFLWGQASWSTELNLKRLAVFLSLVRTKNVLYWRREAEHSCLLGHIFNLPELSLRPTTALTTFESHHTAATTIEMIVPDFGNLEWEKIFAIADLKSRKQFRNKISDLLRGQENIPIDKLVESINEAHLSDLENFRDLSKPDFNRNMAKWILGFVEPAAGTAIKIQDFLRRRELKKASPGRLLCLNFANRKPPVRRLPSPRGRMGWSPCETHPAASRISNGFASLYLSYGPKQPPTG
jgi:hypothetical protein